ncbi:MAG: glycine cleavage system protein H [Acidimicrobiales bacterium]|jgi:glycine cleavage system H protein
MGRVEHFTVAGFSLALDRRYEPETHMWVLSLESDRVLVGMDPLGIETSGTLAELSFDPAGTELVAGRPFGQLEAAKFVGPLVSPITGVVLAVNRAVLGDPGLVERDPYGEGWMIEASMPAAARDFAGLLSDPDEITGWFESKVAGYRRAGLIAE